LTETRIKSNKRGRYLTINLEKTKFCWSQVKYLGFLIQQERLKVDSDKTVPIVKYPSPKNIKQLRCFIGMQEERMGTRGAVVREFPAQRETSCLSLSRKLAHYGATAATQDAAMETTVEARQEVVVQTESADSEPDSMSLDAWEAGSREPPWDSPLEQGGCRNCGSRAHFAQEYISSCRTEKNSPRERHGDCFQCGARRCTVRTCPHCHEGWPAQSPYVRRRRHFEPDLLRGRRASNVTRSEPY